MEREKESERTLMAVANKPKTTLVVALVTTILLAFAGTGCEQPEKVQLKSRTLTPKKGIIPDYQKTLIGALERGEKRHIYVQLKKHLDKTQQAQLEKQGIKLLSYIGSKTWHATLSAPGALEFTSSAAVQRSPILAAVRWIGEIKPEDKIEPKILTKGVGDYNRQPDGRVDVIVVFFPDVSKVSLAAVVKRYGQMVRKPGMLNDVVVRLSEAKIQQLSQEDSVQWIEEVGPPDKDMSDGADAAAEIVPLWSAPYDLDGTNVQVGQWEDGNPDATHGDLIGRVNIVENVGVSDHATHVAGIIAGNGSLSAGAGGTANQWRGVGDQIDIYSYSTQVDNLEPEDHNSAINTWGIDVSNNSWSSGGSNYTVRSAKFDQVVCGIYGRKIPLVFLASNRNHIFNTVAQPGGSAKNTIVVGNINSDDNTISIKSSWGPTDEEQTKPDVVAPGDETGGDTGIKSCVANLFLDIHNNALIPDFGPGDGPDGIDDYMYPYGIKTGTSMSTPVVSGTVALMLQQYRKTYFGDEARNDAPLPSTFKVILCHTAEDLIDNPGGGADLVGPDYVYGYGLINAEHAVNAVQNERFLEGVIHSATDEDTYKFDVAVGEDELKVTLAWDDPNGTVGAADIIQNDLDIVLINPAGSAFYPPWELDPTNPGNPAVRNSYGTEAAADAHRDEHNVVEQVVVDTPAAGTWTIKVKTSDLPYPYQRYSLIAGDQANDRLEGQVDIIQVLDRSGSMGGLASSGSADTKIEVLRNAATHFIDLMKPNVGNQLGLVQFNQNVVAFAPAHDADLSVLTGARAGILTSETVPSINSGGTTSIGDGLNEALNQLTGPAADADHDQVILLVTDGKENTPLWVDDVNDALIASNIAVYALGLGYGSGINEEILSNLADATGGTFRVTSDELIFRKFFIEILAGALDWAVVVDPVGELSKGENVLVPVTVGVDETSSTFTAYWERFNNAIDLTLISPSGTVITPSNATPDTHIRFGKHPRYAFYQLDFPLGGSLAGEWAGQWKMKLSGTNQISSGQKARYSASAFAEGGAKLDVSLGEVAHIAGKAVPIKVCLMKDGKLLSGAQIDVHCDAPAVSVASVLNRGKVSLNELRKNARIKGDSISLVDQKLQILTKQAGKDILPRKMTKFMLFDDGKHGDGKVRDGVYAASFTDNKTPGSYTLRIVASNIPAGKNLTTTREWTTSLYNGINTDPKYSQIDVKRLTQTADGWRYIVKVVPRDQFDNYLGPGHRVSISVSSRYGKYQIKLTDNIDGSYIKDILLPTKELKAGVKLGINIDGKKFTDLKKPIRLP